MQLSPSPLTTPAAFFVRAVIRSDPAFLGFTVAICAVAAIVASFQYVVFTSFLDAGAVIPRTVEADFWVKGRSVECFDFPDPINEDIAGTLARYVPDASFRRVVFGFATWRSPTGRRSNVAVVGIDDSGLPPTGFAADQSDLARLDIAGDESHFAEATIGGETFHLARTVDNLPTFLGAPYVIVPFEQARSLLRLDPSSAAFLIGNLKKEARLDFGALQAEIANDFPEVELVSTADFEFSSSLYWVKKTGAGAAILLAAVLASVLMVILLSNGIARFIQRYQQDLLSLLGHGANERDVSQIVILVAILIASVTIIMAFAITPIVTWLSRPLLPWVFFRAIDMWLPLLAILIALIVSILTSRKAISAYGPEAVFRS